jgi:hypothetical protein
MTLFAGQIETNTAVAMGNPSGYNFDSVFYGGEGIDGPNPMNQNGPWAHLYNASNARTTWGPNFADSVGLVNNWVMEADSFMSATGSTAQYAQVLHRTSTRTASTSTTHAITVSAITAGNLLVIAEGNNNSRTITKVCTDGGTCAAGNSFTQATSAAATSGTNRSDIWYLLSAPSGGSTTITVTFSASATGREGTVWEVARPSGSWAFDLASNTSAGTGSSNTVSSPSITTTGSTGFVAAIAVVGTTVDKSPNPGNECVAGGNIFTGSTDTTASTISSSAAAHQCVWHDTAAADSFGSSIAGFK